MRSHAKASSAGSTEGSGNGRGFLRRALAIRGASRGAKGSSAHSGTLAPVIAALTLIMLTFALTAAPALAEGGSQTINPPDEVGYTTVKVSGTVKESTNDLTYVNFEVSTDGINFKAEKPGNSEFFFFAGEGTHEISKEYTGLTPGKHYYFRIGATVGTAAPVFSNVVEATTLPVAKPTAISANDATDVAYTTAKASGEVQGITGPDPAFDSHCRFEYVTDAEFVSAGFTNAKTDYDYDTDALGEVPTPGVPHPRWSACDPTLVTSEDPTPVTTDIGLLKPGTTYHLRVTISNKGGVDSKEATSTFTTLPVAPPTVLSVNDATDVAYDQAEVSGTIERPAGPDPTAFDAHCRVEYISTSGFNAQNEIQILTVSANSGSYKLRVGSSQSPPESGPIAFDASAAAVQSALEAVPAIGTGNVSVTGGPGSESGETPYTITFVGALSNTALQPLAAISENLGGEAEIQRVAEGHGENGFKNASSVECDPEAATNTGSTEVKAKLTGLAVGTAYRYRIAVSNAGGSDVKEATNTFTTLIPGAPIVSILAPTDVTATSAHFEGTIDPGGTKPGFNVNWHFVCVPKCPGLQGGTIEAESASPPVTVSADTTGLKANTTYKVRLVASNESQRVSAGPEQFTTVAVKPVVITLPAFALAGGTRALVGGKVDPENSATKYWIEYGSDETYGSSIPLSQEGSVGSGNDPVFVTQELTGLQPNATYHLRLIASNQVGVVQGADLAFTTTPAGGLGSGIGKGTLPDNRAWEMVSPPDKNGAGVWGASAMAAISGDGMYFISQGSFAGQPTAQAGLLSDYLSRRGATGWSTQGITPPAGFFALDVGVRGISPDLDFFRVTRRERGNESLDPEADLSQFGPGPIFRSYVRDSASGKYRLLPENYDGFNSDFAGASSDYSHIVHKSGKKLTPDSPCENFGVDCVYETVGNEPTRLVSILPDGEPSFGDYAGNSEDGSRIYWTGLFGSGLYVRVEGDSTIQIAGVGKVAKIEGPSGERATIISSEALVPEDEDSSNDLYLWDESKPEGERLTLLSKGDVPGVAAQVGTVFTFGRTPEDLRRGYFAADNQILAGQPDAAGKKIYFWEADGDETTLKYVATANLNPEGVRVSPDGRYLAFESSDRLTAYDNAGKQEIYRYDSVSGQLICVSCEPQGHPPAAAAMFSFSFATEGGGPSVGNLSSDGEVFFMSTEGLVPRDSNGQRDVYEYGADRLPRLLSSGTSGRESRFMDAGADGDDVFFITVDQLTGWDYDFAYDIYDARADGGLPEPPPGIIGCDGDACQSVPAAPNDPTPSSASFNGPGNLHKKKPKKSKRAKKRHHKKQKQAKRRHAKHKTQRHG